MILLPQWYDVIADFRGLNGDAYFSLFRDYGGRDVMDEVGLELEGGENASYLGDAGRSCFALSRISVDTFYTS
jgi:hypothetical protein